MKDLIDVYLDGSHWCAIYPMGSNIMDCQAIAFTPINKVYNIYLERTRDYGKYQVIDLIRKEYPDITSGKSFYSEYFD
jgi:hypothetical protein